MSRPLDTPARAARAHRPQTREWRRLLSEAAAQDESAVVIRKKLRMHLDAADRLASKLSALSQKEAPFQHTHPLQTLDSLESDWNERVEALQSLCATPNAFDVEPLAPWLSKQLGDLRSKVVVCASDAIASVASARLLSAEQATEIFKGALQGVNISKKVMADARRAAAMAVLEGQTDNSLFVAMIDALKECRHSAGKRLALESLGLSIENANDAATVAEHVKDGLVAGGVDRAPEVREAALQLMTIFKKKFGDEQWSKVQKALPKEVVARLNAKQTSARKAIGETGGRALKAKVMASRKGRPSIRELIRQKREAVEEETTRSSANKQEGAKKRTSEASKLESREEPPKKAALVKAGKENIPGRV